MLLQKSFVRFCIVGLLNTLVDVPLFMILRSSGASIVVANVISTSAALTLSYFLNHHFTFQSQGNKNNKGAYFLVITLVGLWVIQPIVIKLLTILNTYISFSSPFEAAFGTSINFEDLLSKLGSIAVTLIWNYVWYSKFVFKRTVSGIDEK